MLKKTITLFVKNPLFLPVWLVRIIFSMLFTILPLYFASLNIPPSLIGLVIAIYGYAAFFMDITSSIFIDNVKKSNLIKFGIVGIFIFSMGLYIGLNQILYFIILQIILGLSLGIFRPSSSALTVEIAGNKKAGTALGFYNIAYILGGSIGPLLATSLISFANYKGLFLFSCFAILSVLVLVHFILPNEISKHNSKINLRSHFKRLFFIIVHNKLYFPMIMILIDILVLRMWLIYLPLYIKKYTQLDIVQIGLIISIESLIYIITQPFWGKLVDKIGVKIPLIIGLTSPLIIIFTPFSCSFFAFIIIYSVMASLNSAAYPAYMKLAITLSNEKERGKTMSLMSAFSDIGNILGPSLGGIIVSIFGVENVFYIPVLTALIAILSINSILIKKS